MSAEARPINLQIVSTLSEAFRLLGITGGVSNQEQITTAFRLKVKAYATGNGGYKTDMDMLTQAKEFLSTALREIQEKASQERARQYEQQRQKEQAAMKKTAKATTLPPLEMAARRRSASDSDTAPSRTYQALRTWETQKAREREQHRRLYESVVREEQARMKRNQQRKERPVMPTAEGQEIESQASADPIEQALHLLGQRRHELATTRQQEHDMQDALSHLQTQRSKLEQMVQTANHLAEQIQELLTTH